MSACCIERTAALSCYWRVSTSVRPDPVPLVRAAQATHTIRLSRADGTECPLDGPRARKGAGSGGTPDMAVFYRTVDRIKALGWHLVVTWLAGTPTGEPQAVELPSTGSPALG